MRGQAYENWVCRSMAKIEDSAHDNAPAVEVFERMRELVNMTLNRAQPSILTPPAEAREPVGDATLWALHIEGPDDVHPAPSREMAQEAADLFNTTFPQSDDPSWPRAVAKVIEWPHGSKAHALSAPAFVANWLTPTTIRGSAAMQSPTGEPSNG